MDRRLKPFRSTALGESPDQSSLTSDAILVRSGSSQAKVLNGDGQTQGGCPMRGGPVHCQYDKH